MEDMDELFPGIENRRDKSTKKEKKGMSDFFKIHSNNSQGNLMNMFSGNNDENKTTDNFENDEFKGTKSFKKNDDQYGNYKNSNAIIIPEDSSNNEMFDRRKKSRQTIEKSPDPSTNDYYYNDKKKENISFEPPKRKEEEEKDKFTTIKEELDEDNLGGGYFPSRRNNRSIKEDVKKEIKPESSTPNSGENIQYKNMLKTQKQHTSPGIRDNRSDNSPSVERDNSPNYTLKDVQKAGEWDSNDKKDSINYIKNELHTKLDSNNINTVKAHEGSNTQIDSSTEIYKLKIEKDTLEKSLNDQMNRLENDKKRLLENIKEEKEKNKKKDDEYSKFIEELRDRQRTELKNLEENYKKNMDNLTEDNKKLRKEIENAITNERERLTILHKSDLENQDNIMKRTLDEQKRFFEEQNNTLKMTLQQNIEFNKLASKLEISSKQVEDIVKRFVDDKEKIVKSEKENSTEKEKFLNEYDEKLKTYEKNLQVEKEQLVNLKKTMEMRESEKKREFQEERTKIEKESERLHDLQNTLKVLEYNAKEKFDREKLELEHKLQQLKMETDSLKNEYHQKIGDAEYQRKMLIEERSFFEKYKDEAIKNVDLKKANLEERKKQFYEEEREINGRRKVLQEQDFYMKEKFDDFEKIKKEIIDEQRKLESDKKELLSSVSKFKEQFKNYEEKSFILEKDKEQIYKKYQDLESERALISNEKLKIEQSKTELRLRMQSMDALRIKYVASVSDNVGINNNNLMSMSMTNNFKTHYPPSEKGIMNNNYITAKNESFMKVNSDNLNKTFNQTRKSFNCDEYLTSLKNKLGNVTSDLTKNDNFTDYIFQEKEYLKKSIAINNAPEKDFEFEIKKELDKINQRNSSMYFHNDFQNTFENNKLMFSTSNNFSKPYGGNYNEKPNFEITDSKQFLNNNNNELINRSILQENRNPQLSSSNLDKKIERPSFISTPNLNYNNNLKQEKINDNNFKGSIKDESNEKIKKMVMDDEFDI